MLGRDVASLPACAGTFRRVKGVVVRGRPVGSDDDNWFVNRTVKMFEKQFDSLDSHIGYFSSRKESDDEVPLKL